MNEKFIVSYSSLAAFKNCPKSYEIEYEWGRQSNHDNKYIKKGSIFHKYMEDRAKKNFDAICKEDESCEMYSIALDYIEYKPLPEKIIYCEESLYYEIFPGVDFRVTPDLVYDKGDRYICRDYKTFGKRPSMDLHISDQGRFYIIILEALHPGIEVEFEFEYVRSERIGVPRPRSPAWKPRDGYFTLPYTLSLKQKERTWRDLEEGVMALLDARERKQFYRTGRMGSAFGGCIGCLQRPLCSEEWEHGFVSQDSLERLSTQREPFRREIDEL